MNIESLIANQRAAHAAWLACPDKRRAEKAALEAALSAAARAVAEAKRAAAPAPAPVADIDGAIAAAASRQRAVDLVARVRRAAGLYMAAQEWPRCGQRWPMGQREIDADALLRQHGNEVLGEGWEQ